jgi:hypothetical protein
MTEIWNSEAAVTPGDAPQLEGVGAPGRGGVRSLQHSVASEHNDPFVKSDRPGRNVIVQRRPFLKKALVAIGAAVCVVAAGLAPTTASARPGYWHGGWHGGWHGPGYWRGGWGPRPGVFAAGVLGVAIGASLAHPYYGPPPASYAGPGYWGYYGGCRSYWRWVPGLGRYVRDTRCW